MTIPACLHRDAFKVDSSVVPGLIWRCWCPGCETGLPAAFRFPCCGAEPGDGTEPARHAYNCAGTAGWSPSPPQPAVPVVTPVPARRRRRVPAILFPVLAAGLIAGVLMAVALRPHGPQPAYHRNPADQAACYAYQQAASTDLGGDWVNAIADGMSATAPLGDLIVAAQQRYGPQEPPIAWCNAHGYPVSLP